MLLYWHYSILLTLSDAEHSERQQLAHEMLIHIINITDNAHIILLTLLHFTHIMWCWQLRMPTTRVQDASSRNLYYWHYSCYSTDITSYYSRWVMLTITNAHKFHTKCFFKLFILLTLLMLFYWHYSILLTLGDADNYTCQQVSHKMLIQINDITDFTHVILLTLLHITRIRWRWQLRMPITRAWIFQWPRSMAIIWIGMFLFFKMSPEIHI